MWAHPGALHLSGWVELGSKLCFGCLVSEQQWWDALSDVGPKVCS